MSIIVSDTSCMIDLRKVGLLEELLQLPHTFVMPDVLFEDEWLCLAERKKAALREKGLEVTELSGETVEKASQHFNRHAPLALNDCFVLALAEETEDRILLTGDGHLRQVAQHLGIQARGVLWVIDELQTHTVVGVEVLHAALKAFHHDDTIFLPEDEVVRRLQRLGRILRQR